MLSGFNTNFRYRGVLFHVQTEDSGRVNPHVITHLFHGGNIMTSVKGAYGDKLHLDDASLEIEVKALMEGQHKSMLKKLSKGGFDETIVQRLGPDVFAETVADVTDDAEVVAPEDAAAAAQAARQAGPAHAASPAAAAASDSNESTQDRMSRAFGQGVVSNKPLDEVVLDFLVENARKRKRSAK
jgi:hypothetical protein